MTGFSRTMAASAVFLTAALALSPAFAQGGGRGGRSGMNGRPMSESLPPARWLEALNLTEAQRAKITEIRSEKSKELSLRREESRKLRERLQEMMRGNANESELRNLHEQVQSARQALAKIRFESVLAIRQVLTPEQRESFGSAQGRLRDRRSQGGWDW